MRIRVLLFGPEAAAVGRPAVEVSLEGDRTDGRTLLEHLAAEHPALAPHLRSARLAVNHEFAEPTRPIHATDEVALIGLVSGG